MYSHSLIAVVVLVCCLRSETVRGRHQEPAKDSDPGRGPVQHCRRQHGVRHQGTVDDADGGTPGGQTPEIATQGPEQSVPARHTQGKKPKNVYDF